MSENSSIAAVSVKPFAYSLDRETFRGEFATREQAAEAGLRAAADRSVGIDAIFVGKRVPVDPQADHHADEIVHSMRRRMLSRNGDASYLADADEHKQADLDAAIARTINEWLVRHQLGPAARITSISEHPLPAVRAHGPAEDDEVQQIGPEVG